MHREFEAQCHTAAGTMPLLTDVDLEPATGIVTEVLETMFFAEAVSADCDGHEWLASAVSDRIGFDGSYSGEMRLSVSLEAASALAAAFLGIEPLETTELLRAQVILELTNILCGAILSRLCPESKLALAPPEAVGIEQEGGRALHQCSEM